MGPHSLKSIRAKIRSLSVLKKRPNNTFPADDASLPENDLSLCGASQQSASTNHERIIPGETDAVTSEGSREACQHCLNLDKNNFPTKEGIIAFRPDQVMRASNIECPYCQFLINAMRTFEVGNPLSARPWVLSIVFGNLILRGEEDGQNHKLEFYVTTDEKRSAIVPSSINPSKHVRSIWEDPEQFELLKGWLDEETPKATSLPSRILDLGTGYEGRNADTLGDEIQILERPTKDESGVYAALSHCWLREDIETTKTLLCNVESRRKGLLLRDLPDTFVQAISVCRRIGVQYLWIDSLCIIQDDTADWEREAADMNRVYANAWFAIAMHHSTHGCMPFKDVELSIGDQLATIHVRRIPELRGIMKGKAVAPAVGEKYKVADNIHWSSVSQRGWCYQERVLSRRMVHFTKHEFLCEEKAQLVRCQCNQHFGAGPGFAGALARRPRLPGETDRSWGTLVQQYTERMFGRRSDILPGFAGVAKAFSNTREPGRYIAGLWEHDLLKWLCWRSKEWVSARTGAWVCEDCRPHPLRVAWTRSEPIPSFSWASRFGPCQFVYVSWKLEGSIEVASIEGIECLMDEENPFLKVRGLNPEKWPDDPCGRYLRIRGSLYPCLHFSTYGRGFDFNVSMSLCQKEFAWAVPDHFVKTWDFSRDAKSILEDARKLGKEYVVDAGDDLPPDNSRIYLLPLYEHREPDGKLCLILRPCTEKLNREILSTGDGTEQVHWMERIGISLFDGYRFDVMEESRNQVIHLM